MISIRSVLILKVKAVRDRGFEYFGVRVEVRDRLVFVLCAILK